jgi:uncharacterized membrane protein
MSKGRLEAFSDGVLAIVITIMVLELVPPDDATLDALFTLWPKFLSYVLSFALLGIYWNNHHHLLQAAHSVSASVLWANMHLLFWLSLIPFGTAWMGETSFAAIPTAVYGALQIMPAIAFTLLIQALLRAPNQPPALALATRSQAKGLLSMGAYIVSVPLALVQPLAAVALFVATAVMWIVPQRSIEQALNTRDAG